MLIDIQWLGQVHHGFRITLPVGAAARNCCRYGFFFRCSDHQAGIHAHYHVAREFVIRSDTVCHHPGTVTPGFTASPRRIQHQNTAVTERSDFHGSGAGSTPDIDNAVPRQFVRLHRPHDDACIRIIIGTGC